jgi:GNAT superfamily N-acetyltransferase
MTEFIAYDPKQHTESLRQLLTAYLEEGSISLKEAGIEEDITAVVEDDLTHVEQFAPPAGRLLIVVDDGIALGCGALRIIAPGVAEIKRMYLRPDARGRGLGRMLLDRLIAEARNQGCHEARLDTGWFMMDAQRLYRAAGFTECEPYAESEVPADFDPRWIYMRRDLSGNAPTDEN